MLAVLFRSQLPFVDPESHMPRLPRDAIQAANRALCEACPAPGLFLTAAYCLLDTEQRTATVASAGHPPLLLLRSSGAVERIFHTGPALGLYPEAPYTQQEVTLEAGDRMLFYSDGLYGSLPRDAGSPTEAIATTLERETGHGLEVLQRLLAASQAPASPDYEAPEDDAASRTTQRLMLPADLPEHFEIDVRLDLASFAANRFEEPSFKAETATSTSTTAESKMISVSGEHSLTFWRRAIPSISGIRMSLMRSENSAFRISVRALFAESAEVSS